MSSSVLQGDIKSKKNFGVQGDIKSKEFLESETKEIIGKTHRTNKLVIRKFVSTRCARE